MTGLNLFQVQRVGGTLVVAVHDGVGSFADSDILEEMTAVVTGLRDSHANSVVVDFDGVDYFGSSMLEALRLLWNELEKTGGRMSLCNLSEVSREILSISHLDRLWPVCESREQALAAVLS